MRPIFGITLSLLGLGCAPTTPPPSPSTGQPAATAQPTKAMAPVVGDHNLLRNGDFEGGTLSPWMVTMTAPARGEVTVTDGKLCATISNPGHDPWDFVVRHRGLSIERGHQYMLRFWAESNESALMRPSVVMAGPPYVEYFAANTQLGAKRQAFAGAFEMGLPADDAAELVFHLGTPRGENPEKAEGPVTICLDDVRLDDPAFEPPRRFARGPRIAVNAHGYLPPQSKVSTLAHKVRRPVPWKLVDAEGRLVLEGKTSFYGEDRASGDLVHHIDFSSVREGRGLRLVAAGATSDPFDIRSDLYRDLKRQALAYFYHNRSGVPIEADVVGDPRWARPAGHLGDKSVGCLPDMKCGYALDVSGGWYDAGDHGKYVVNGGIAVWTLLNLFERTQQFGDVKALGDGALAIPEHGNGMPDLLDEVRFGLDMFLRMQVPKGPYAGMAHHKIHDDKWADLPMAPDKASLPRHLHPPSTAATLNLAAMAAQGARVFRAFDADFAQRCLGVAKRAWAAAEKHPAMFADPSDTVGGGPYGDVDVSDERYWAATELYLTTHDATYEKAMKASKHYLVVPSPQEGHLSPMTWAMVGALGTISLAVVPSPLDAQETRKARSAVTRAAGAFVYMVAHEGYRLPFDGGANTDYPWGSNASVVNNMLVLGLAHDFTKKPAFFDAMVSGLNYLLGSNPLRTSYVTGYGELAVEQPHHRFWAAAKDPKFPPPPPGVLAGGPNTGLDDPIAKKELRGCSPQKCWLDHFEAWSLNEVAINWNAPLAWVATVIDERAQ